MMNTSSLCFSRKANAIALSPRSLHRLDRIGEPIGIVAGAAGRVHEFASLGQLLGVSPVDGVERELPRVPQAPGPANKSVEVAIDPDLDVRSRKVPRRLRIGKDRAFRRDAPPGNGLSRPAAPQSTWAAGLTSLTMIS
jgi:hypothetical protein